MRIALYGMAVVALVLSVISVLFLLLIAGSVPRTQDEELAARSAAAVAAIGAADPAGLVPRSPLAPVDLATGSEIVVVLLDERGGVLETNGVLDGRPPAVPAVLLDRAGAAGAHGVAETMDAGGAESEPVRLRVHVRLWKRPDVSRAGYAVAAQTLRRQQTDRQGAIAVVVASGFATMIAAAIGIWLTAGRALRPLRRLTATADEIGRSADLSRRLPPEPRGDELGRLTESFNAMLARLEDAYRRMASALAAQQRFTADASHELRTPLTTVRSSAGFLRSHPDAAATDRAAALEDIEAESARMSRLVDDLLTLARADGGQPMEHARVDLGSLAQQVCRQAASKHPNRNLHCPGAPVTVTGDPEALRRLLWILVDNAVAHTADGGNIWVVVAGHARGATVQVSDDGPGIPPGMQERIFERFVRADESRRRGGAGLGLSIARWIVRAHGGEIRAANHERGGASFVADLPGRPEPPTAPLIPSSNP